MLKPLESLVGVTYFFPPPSVCGS